MGPGQDGGAELGAALWFDELDRLGYRTIGPIGSFGADKQQVLAALDRFAGNRALHTEQEFLDRDPRIQPEMI